jgi:hypothetical protein
MSDAMRSDPFPAPAGAAEPDRDAKIEQLLLVGLDHYFAAEFEQAINVWTRALFLDRSHARARAYIERARSALAEQQRESEELLQDGLAAFRRGEGDEARRLLESAMSRGAPREEALAVLDRLSRLEQGSAPPRLPVETHVAPPPSRTAGGPRRIYGVTLAVGALLALAVVLPAAYSTNWRSLLEPEPATAQAPAVSSPVDSSLPMPLRGEIALTRARSLAAGGHLHDALAALEAVKPTDAQKPDADRLRASIQRQLIDLASVPAGAQKAADPLP